MNNKIIRYNALLFISLLFTSFIVQAEELIMMRVTQSFPETMVSLQSAISKTGYKISRVQRVDIGLTKSGYQTDKYRVVFFGKADEIKQLSEELPDMIPYLPLKISIFSEQNDTIVIANNPVILASYFEGAPKKLFNQWYKDIKTIFELTKKID